MLDITILKKRIRNKVEVLICIRNLLFGSSINKIKQNKVTSSIRIVIQHTDLYIVNKFNEI